MSKPSSEEIKKDQKHDKKKIVELSTSTDLESWRDIVQKRIDSKTKRFVKGRTQPEPTPVANKFSKVAGHFFFPLMKNFDR